MTPQQGKGVQSWIRLANDALSSMSRERASDFFDNLSASTLAEMMEAASAAGVAVDGETGGCLLLEAGAKALRELSNDGAEAEVRQ